MIRLLGREQRLEPGGARMTPGSVLSLPLTCASPTRAALAKGRPVCRGWRMAGRQRGLESGVRT